MSGTFASSLITIADIVCLIPTLERAMTNLAVFAVHHYVDPAENVWERLVDCDNLARCFTGFGPIPAINRAEIVGGGPLMVGAIRRVHNSDGSVLDEIIMELARGKVQVYRVESGLRAPLRFLARRFHSRWEFSSTEGGSKIEWTFRFHLTSPLLWPFCRWLVAPFVKRAMSVCLANLAIADWQAPRFEAKRGGARP